MDPIRFILKMLNHHERISYFYFNIVCILYSDFVKDNKLRDCNLYKIHDAVKIDRERERGREVKQF